MRVLLVSTYELGHQPLHLASPAAALEAAGHVVDCLDVAVDRWDVSKVDGADAVAFSVPMHTAMRLAMKGADAVRRRRPDVPICFYGLYAEVSKERTLGSLADRLIAGEYEPALVGWVGSLDQGADRRLDRQRYHLPVRAGLPPLERYAHLAIGGEERTVGYVEATRGCSHRCRHCPVPVVYDGRTRKVPVDTVLEDVAGLVDAGARHVTFGDPDFLNRANHAFAVSEALHAAFPDVTYDFTAKVEHLLRYHMMLPRLAETGCLFVVSAYECVNDRILRLLDKGHTAAESSRATALLREHGIEPRPSWLPFTPWTTVEDVADICEFIVQHDLIGNVDPVQLTIRLLVPQGSLLLGLPEMQPYLGPYDPDALTYTWTAADPRTVDLQRRLADVVERDVAASKGLTETFCDVRDAVLAASGFRGEAALATASVEGRPRLTEPWFC